MKRWCLALLAALALRPMTVRAEKPEEVAARFLSLYNSLYVGLTRVAQEAAWKASTDVSPETEAMRTTANTALAALVGDKTVIETSRALLAQRGALAAIALRQLGKILLAAAETPGTIPAVSAARVAAESKQASIQDGYTYRLEGKAVSANQLDETLTHSRNLEKRLRAWEASKAIGVPLRDGLAALQKLRNQVAREMKYPSYFALQVADYDMTEQEMMTLLDGFVTETRPLYQRLHAWVRQRLAARYHKPVPKLIPAHWIDNRWSQEWTGLVEGTPDLDRLFKDRSPEWIMMTAERFYVSMGFPSLSQKAWERSDLYPVPPQGKRKKNSHASCWHIDLQDDIRMLMSVTPNARWFRTAHHELGHAYYFLAYSRPEVPPILRQGLNRAMHEAMGDLAAIAASQVPYLTAIGVLPRGTHFDERALLLEEALESAIPFMAWSAGTMTHFERDLYSGDLPPAEWQSRWWKYVAQFQGIAPPETPPREGCDACSKTHINDLPAQYYNYAISAVLKYQLHDHICRRILRQDPHACNYYGHKEVGAFLHKILDLGATRPWREVLLEATGEPLSSRAMLSYFAPLERWLDGELAGKPVGW